MITKNDYSKTDCGCYLDGNRGIYLGESVQRWAKDHGWTGERLQSDHEFYFDAWDEANAYMNENYPVENCYWGENENGDWGLWENS